MKKLLKFAGLLLIAGALFTACSTEPNIVTDKFDLSDGNWKFVSQSSQSYKSSDGKIQNMSEKEDVTVTIAGGVITPTAIVTSASQSMTYPEGTDQSVIDAEKAKAEKYKEEGDTVTVNGTTITLTYAPVENDPKALAEFKKDSPTVEAFNSDIPEGMVIKSNKKKTEYTFSYTEEETISGYTYTVSVTGSIKKL